MRAPCAAREDVGVVEEPIGECGGGDGVAEQLALVLDGPVREQPRSGRVAGPLRRGPSCLGRPGPLDSRRPLRREHGRQLPRRAHQEADRDPAGPGRQLTTEGNP